MKKQILFLIIAAPVFCRAADQRSPWDRQADATRRYNDTLARADERRRDAINKWFDSFSIHEDGSAVEEPVRVPEHIRQLANRDNMVINVPNKNGSPAHLNGHLFGFKDSQDKVHLMLMTLPGGLYRLKIENSQLKAEQQYSFTQQKGFVKLLVAGVAKPVLRSAIRAAVEAPPPIPQPLAVPLPDFSQSRPLPAPATAPEEPVTEPDAAASDWQEQFRVQLMRHHLDRALAQPRPTPADGGVAPEDVDLEEIVRLVEEQMQAQAADADDAPVASAPVPAPSLPQRAQVRSSAAKTPVGNQDDSFTPLKAGAFAAFVSSLLLAGGYSAQQLYKLYRHHRMRLTRRHAQQQWHTMRNRLLRNAGVASILTMLSGIGAHHLWHNRGDAEH